MTFHVITLFPEMFDSYLKESILARAIREKKIKIKFYNPRDFAPKDLKKRWPDGNVTTYIDDRPYGGGPGMVMRAEPILGAVESALRAIKNEELRIKNSKLRTTKLKANSKKQKARIIFLSPSGKKFNTQYAKHTARSFSDIILISGRYEGIDFRVKKILKAEEISIGDYVTTGGELPAMILIDSVARQIEGVLGKYESLEEERVSSSEIYTRPEVLKYRGKSYKVPKILLSGDHKMIESWKKMQK